MSYTYNNVLKQGVWRMVLGAVIVLSCAPSAASDKNYASQLELANCGAYTISSITVQGKWHEYSDWEDLYVITKDLPQNNAMCIDVDEDDHYIDQYRLKVYIGGGDIKKCDSTNYQHHTKRRSMTMKGTTLNNNGCRSQEYRELSGSCSKQGTLREISC